MKGWAPVIETIKLLPSSKGRFEVVLDGKLIFSKAELGRHAKDGEVARIVRGIIGDEIPRD